MCSFAKGRFVEHYKKYGGGVFFVTVPLKVTITYSHIHQTSTCTDSTTQLRKILRHVEEYLSWKICDKLSSYT